MLILTRKVNESIFVGPDVEIKVSSIHGNTVKIGIIAPKETPVLRGELLKEIKEATKQSVEKKQEAENEKPRNSV